MYGFIVFLSLVPFLSTTSCNVPYFYRHIMFIAFAAHLLQSTPLPSPTPANPYTTPPLPSTPTSYMTANFLYYSRYSPHTSLLFCSYFLHFRRPANVKYSPKPLRLTFLFSSLSAHFLYLFLLCAYATILSSLYNSIPSYQN